MEKADHSGLLIKSNLYLANCDPVRKLSRNELKSRLNWGLAIADKIIISPNMLIDYPEIMDFFTHGISGNILSKDKSRIILRHTHNAEKICFVDYYENLEGDYFFSGSISKSKKTLSNSEITATKYRLSLIDKIADDLEHKRLNINEKSLSESIAKYIEKYTQKNIPNEKSIPYPVIKNLLEKNKNTTSRSQWYQYINSHPEIEKYLETIKYEIIDPAYNDIHIITGEAFSTDCVTGTLPLLADSALFLEAHQEKINNAIKALKYIHWVHTLGASGVIMLLKDIYEEEAGEKIIDKLKKNIEASSSWKAIYPKLRNHLGISVKSND